MNIRTHMKQTALIGVSIVSVCGGIAFTSGIASAEPLATDATTSLSATEQTHLQNIITKGNQEIARRLATLTTLQAKITAATKLTASDKATLSSEVSSAISGLTTLKTQLDSSTTVAAAIANAQSIFTEYRVYALVAPKISLIKVADDQQVAEQKLATLAQKLQARITADQQAGKSVTTLQADLNDMNAKLSASTAISSSIEANVINLQPSDYNSNHAVLSGDNTQLKTAHSDNEAAFADAKNIVTGLKSL